MSNIVSDVTSIIQSTLKEGTSYGKTDNTKLLSYKLKLFTLAVPGIIFGHYIDQYIYKLKQEKVLSEATVNYVAAQLAFNGLIIYILSKIHRPYTQEFQSTIVGLFFVSLFFGMQVNLISNIQETLNNLYKL